MPIHSKLVVKSVNELYKEIKNIIKKCWNFKRLKVDDYINSFSLMNFNLVSVKASSASNLDKALSNLLNSFGVDNFFVREFSTYPRFDVSKSRKTGFSHSGGNKLLIAFRSFEKGHIEVDYEIYTDWYF